MRRDFFSSRTLGLLLVPLLLFVTTVTVLTKHSPPRILNAFTSSEPGKPAGLKIIALVFYGRPENVKTLDCYLKKELTENGGYLDEVLWVANTDKAEDLNWLDDVLLPSSRSYRKASTNQTVGPGNFGGCWDFVERGNLYIKLDDDVSYIHGDAIKELVHVRLARPDAYMVSSNIINSPLMTWVHYRTGAVSAYMPELEPQLSPNGEKQISREWRASAQPSWQGSADTRFAIDAEPPFDGHRWLPVRDKNLSHPAFPLRNTPIHQAQYAPWGNSGKSWPIIAQEHASMLENIEKDALHLYKTSSKIWDVTGERLTINLIALWGDDVVNALPLHDDELQLSQLIPDKLQRPVIVATHSIAAHFAFRPQKKLSQTNLLGRYTSYAEEMICPGKMLPS